MINLKSDAHYSDLVSKRSSGFDWAPESSTVYDPMPLVQGGQISETTPANVKLLEWAAKPENQPPQSWYDEEIDPFSLRED